MTASRTCAFGYTISPLYNRNMLLNTCACTMAQLREETCL